LGLVSQEPQLFATTIAENIRFGKESATMDEIVAAARAANAHDFIAKLPSGYDTLVGEKGVQMSGGQKQRIAIARAIVKNPSVLLLDEATSALDTENERLVQEALDRMMTDRTTIVIAHRLATVKNADKIVVIKEGRVVEEGKHEELLALNGLYFHLVQKQTKAKEEEEPKELGAEPIVRADVVVRGGADEFPQASTDSLSPMLVHSPSGDPEKGAVKVEKDKPYPFSYTRLIRESRPEAAIIALGIAAACTNGSIMPIFAIIYSEIVATFQKPDPKDVKEGANFLAAMFVCLAVGAGVANVLQIFSFSTVGEKLTFRLRDYSFKSILRQDIGWFDHEKNGTGILTTKLATDATLVQGVTTQRVSLIFQNIATIVAGLVIAFVAGWKLSLVILACMPLVVISSSFQMKFMKGFSADSQSAYEKAGTVSTEAVGGIRTVASFTNEEKLLKMYSDKLEEPARLGVKKAHVSGIGFGASQFCMFAVNTLAFWYGGRLVDQREWKVSQKYIIEQCTKPSVTLPFAQCENQVYGLEGFAKMMRVFFAIIMMGMGLGQSSSFAPDAAKASAAASSIYEIIDRKSPIDPEQEGGARPKMVEGNIEFKNVHFAYPTRPNVQIFKGFNLTVPAGKTVALVGDSGGGKSTVISLLERFYDPAQGGILLDGTDIKTLDLKFLRSQISLVSQEPSLFSTTIAKNIAYGKDDATLEEIQAAAKMANCHSFITALPEGYNTLLGDKYTQLSGGQKQRVAIARALLCNPKVMLLDEATSALDSESEHLVQEALERVMEGRTTIVIAHRLSTIINADIIAVMKGGQIVELGNHQDLLAHGGIYTNLVKRQL
jgi:ATP-binding cassette subfamily B (MDR/TAP) protein 1